MLIDGHFQRSSTCRELFNQVVAHQCLEETHIFGLTIINVDQGNHQPIMPLNIANQNQ